MGRLPLDAIAKAVAPGSHALLIVDQAGWHRANCLQVPDQITRVTLPPYSPELNRMENGWAYLRGNKLAIPVFKLAITVFGRTHKECFLGCIGSFVAQATLIKDLASYASKAATADTRSTPSIP